MTERRDLSGTGHKESLIGICAAIGDDFGFNPDILRVALAVGLLFAPMVVLGCYAAAGVVVLASRLLVPARRRVRPAAVTALPAPAAAAAPDEVVPMLEAA